MRGVKRRRRRVVAMERRRVSILFGPTVIFPRAGPGGGGVAKTWLFIE